MVNALDELLSHIAGKSMTMVTAPKNYTATSGMQMVRGRNVVSMMGRSGGSTNLSRIVIMKYRFANNG